jgi:hypothetical protein
MPKHPDELHCPTCGYDLHGLPHNVCPECGIAFDPQALRDRAAPSPLAQVIAPAAISLSTMTALAGVYLAATLGLECIDDHCYGHGCMPPPISTSEMLALIAIASLIITWTSWGIASTARIGVRLAAQCAIASTTTWVTELLLLASL